MGLSTYPDGSPFNGVIGDTYVSSVPSWPVGAEAPEGSPNVIVILLDDLGFAQLGCYGGLGGRVKSPHIDRLAAEGIRFQNFHTTALCSPTRAALLTGRNHHSVGVATIMERATGFPGYNGRVTKDTAMLPMLLRNAGYNTMALGKWHLTPDEQTTPAGPFDRWPLAQGFERFYGFLPGLTSQWEPELWEDNHMTSPPATPDQGYHLSADLVDKAIQWISEQKGVAPSKPFFQYLAFGATHSPHHAPAQYIEPYRGVFDAGWDVIRQESLDLQKKSGIMPDTVEIPPLNPGVKAWDTLSPDLQRLFARQMETFAGFITHTDDQIGRLIKFLDDADLRENTIVLLLSDNGASAEGSSVGFMNENAFINGETADVDEMLAHLDEWGSPTTHPHYASGWAMAGNTPNRMYKAFVHEGGTRDPLIVSWPRGIKDVGTLRTQFHHVVDVTPTILDLIGLDVPDQVNGIAQRPVEGTSFAYTFNDAAAPTRKLRQYFEMFAHRAMYEDGWKAVTMHWSKAVLRRLGHIEHELNDGDFAADKWELYHLDSDPSEQFDLAEQEPQRLQSLIELWWDEARRYRVLPLDERLLERMFEARPRIMEDRETTRFASRVRLPRSGSPDVRHRSHRITASFNVPDEGAQGVIVSNGGESGGYTLCLLEGRLHYVSNHLGKAHYVATSSKDVSPGDHTAIVDFESTGGTAGKATLRLDDEVVGGVDVVATNFVTYAVAEGLEVGSDCTSPVWPRYHSPFHFSGTIREVIITTNPAEVEYSPREAALQLRADMTRQ